MTSEYGAKEVWLCEDVHACGTDDWRIGDLSVTTNRRRASVVTARMARAHESRKGRRGSVVTARMARAQEW